MLNPSVKKVWVDALRSGEYVQGTGYLKTDDDRYCCLGVLCDVYRKEHNEGEFSSAAYFLLSTDDDEYPIGLLPDFIKKWSGIDDDTCGLLANFNDFGQSFQKIADYIDSRL